MSSASEFIVLVTEPVEDVVDVVGVTTARVCGDLVAYNDRARSI